MSEARRNRRKERRRRERELERKAGAAVERMPRPRLGEDLPIFTARWERWIEQEERDASGDQELLNRVQQLAGPVMETHTARLLADAVDLSRAERRMERERREAENDAPPPKLVREVEDEIAVNIVEQCASEVCPTDVTAEAARVILMGGVDPADLARRCRAASEAHSPSNVETSPN